MRNLTIDIIESIIQMKQAGLPNKTIVQNLNFIAEPRLGFSKALELSDLCGQYLKATTEINHQTFNEFLKAEAARRRGL